MYVRSAGDRTYAILTILSVVATLIVVTVQPAQAAPYWQDFTLTDTWTCGNPSEPKARVYQRSCVVANANKDLQAVVTLDNRSGLPVYIEAYTLQLIKNGIPAYTTYCHRSTLNTGFKRACFGRTVWKGSELCPDFEAMAVIRYYLSSTSSTFTPTTTVSRPVTVC